MDRLVQDLQKSFEELGVIVDKTVLDACVTICHRYNVQDAEEFVATWMAYSLSKLDGENPTIEYLNKFEKDEYVLKSKNQKSTLVIYEASNVGEINMESMSDIIRLYDENASKEKNGSELRTPESSKKSRNKSSPRATFSPASFSPTITSLSSKYASRTNSGEVVFPYKNEEFTSNRDALPLKIERLNSVEIQRYMNFDLIDAVEYADDAINKIGTELLKKFSLEEPMPVRHKHPSTFVTIGRIACDSDGRLNAKSVILEGTRDLSAGEAIHLDLEGVEKFSVFPGQVVAVEGVNLTGDTLMAKKIFCDASVDSPQKDRPRGTLSMVIAAGPYTQSDSMTYQPLLDLIEIVSSEEPDVLILTGPFIDSTHPVIIENSLAETYKDLFTKMVDRIMRPLLSKKTQVLMVSSYRDCNAHHVYPTPELGFAGKMYHNLHLLPDPSMVEVRGIIIGVTSTDILMHIGKEEISSPGYSSDRLSRLAGHVLSQRNFYPLAPATGVPVDPLFMESAKLNVKPHVLVLPSDLRYFIKNVFDCVVVNPERLAKGVIGGTYARLNLTSTGLEGNIIRI